MRLVFALVSCAALAAACKSKESAKKPPPAQLAGLDAVPASARVVIGADPRRLAGSELVARAVTLMLAREPDLGPRVAALADGCGLDWTKLESVHLAITDDSPQPMLIATGPIAEADLAKCVQSTVGAGGGSLSLEEAEGRTVYRAVDGKRAVFFAFGRNDTVVLSASRELVVAGLGTGAKVLGAPEMKTLIGRADTRAPLWAAGRLDPTLGQRMLRLTRGKVTTPPEAFVARLDPTAGIAIELSAVMASEDDAKALESQLIPTLQLIAIAAQVRGLGPLAAKITGSRDGDVVRFGVSLTEDEVKEVLSKVDSRAPSDEDAGPASGD